MNKGITHANGIPVKLSAIHGHHIVMKGAMDPYSVASRTLLRKYRIPILETKDLLNKTDVSKLHNMAFAINNYKGIHSAAYAEAVYKRLMQGASKNGKKGVIEALADMKEILEKGETFW